MPGPDDKSKPSKARPKLAETLPLDAKKTLALSPAEADKIREKLRAAGAPSAPAPTAPRTQALGPEEARKALDAVEKVRASATAAQTAVLAPEDAARARGLVWSEPQAPAGKSTAKKAPAANPSLKSTLPLQDAKQAVLSPFGPPAPPPAVGFGADEVRKALEKAEKAPARPPATVEKTEILSPEERKHGRDPRRSKKRDGPSKITRAPTATQALTKTLPLAGAPRRPGRAKAPVLGKPKTAPSPEEGTIEQALASGVGVLSGAKLAGARLVRADLRGADLRKADLADADLGHADLSLARLEDANLSFANLYKTKLDGAELRGATRVGTRKVNPDRV